METTKIHVPPARRRGWLRKRCWIVGVLVVLVVIRELALRLQRAGADLAAMTVKGPYDAAKGEGRLGLEFWGVDRQLLNLVGAPWGARFNDTKLAATNRIELAQGGEAITASGALAASKFSLTQMGQTTPELDFTVGFDPTLKPGVLELRTARLKLTPTARGRNQLDVTGRVDYSKLDAITGGLKLAAESLDVTTLYDPLTSQAAAAGATAPPDASPPGGDDRLSPGVRFGGPRGEPGTGERRHISDCFAEQGDHGDGGDDVVGGGPVSAG